MTHDEVMARLESFGGEKGRATNARYGGAGENQFGAKMGDIRALAKEIKSDQALGLELWANGNYEAMILACYIMSAKKFSADEIDRMQRMVPSKGVSDAFNTNIVKAHPEKESLRVKWMADDNLMAARGGWSLTTERVLKSPDGLDLPALMDRIEKEMGAAPEPLQWIMNYCLASIGIEFPQYRERAIAIGEKIGAFKDYPVSKGCVSPFAPIWITEMVSRKG